MKNILVLLLSVLAFSSHAQDVKKEKKPSKHELGIEFYNIIGNDFYNNINASFLPSLTYNYYRTERNILHLKMSYSFAGYIDDFPLFYNGFGGQVSLDFWNEYRNYVGKTKKWFLSHGFTANAGYSNYTYPGDFAQYDWAGASVGVGYQLGAGYKINNHFTLNLSVNPRVTNQWLNYKNVNPSGIIKTNRLEFQMPINVGMNYRF